MLACHPGHPQGYFVRVSVACFGLRLQERHPLLQEQQEALQWALHLQTLLQAVPGIRFHCCDDLHSADCLVALQARWIRARLVAVQACWMRARLVAVQACWMQARLVAVQACWMPAHYLTWLSVVCVSLTLRPNSCMRSLQCNRCKRGNTENHSIESGLIQSGVPATGRHQMGPAIALLQVMQMMNPLDALHTLSW
jgi:hypothetical protein